MKNKSISFHPDFSTTNRITAALTKIERARGFLDAATLSEEWVVAMAHRAFVREAHYSTHIEGTHLTLEQSEKVLEGKSISIADPNDVRELLNYRKAFDFVSDYLNSGAPITEGLIREIHKHLVSSVRGDKATPGQYRKVQNYVVNSQTGKTVYTPPPAYDVPILMADLVSWLNSESDIHPVLISGIAQFQLVHIHPFLDGNGRTSRLLSTLCLYRTGYDFKRLFTISEFYDRDRPAFYKAIQSVRENKMDMTEWIEYFVDGLATQMLEVKQRGELAIKRDLIVRKYDLSERQRKGIDFALAKGNISMKEFEEICKGTTRRTLERDMKALVEKNLFKPEGATNKLVYVLQLVTQTSDKLAT
jgi:Fic family protein